MVNAAQSPIMVASDKPVLGAPVNSFGGANFKFQISVNGKWQKAMIMAFAFEQHPKAKEPHVDTRPLGKGI